MEKTKYKWAGDQQSILSLYNVNRAKCDEWIGHLTNLIQSFIPMHLGDIIPIEALIVWAEQDPKRIKWLLEKGYIEEVQSEMEKWEDEGRNGMTHTEKIEWAKRMPRQD